MFKRRCSMEHITKFCADSLRTYIKDNYDIKLKAAHAHELVAAYFGYKSRAALLVDKVAPITDLQKAEIIVMVSDSFVDQRRKQLEGLPSELPSSYKLGESVYTPLFSNNWHASLYPPFRSFEKLAKFVIDSDSTLQQAFRFYENAPVHHILDVKSVESSILLTILHSYQISAGELLTYSQTTIKLPRVAGHIGYGKAHVSFETLTGDARKVLRANLGVQL